MRILIISRTTWNNSNSFGNTFSNIFGGMQDVEMFNICCQNGSTANDIVVKTLQISESSVIRGLKGGDVRIPESAHINSIKEQYINNTVKKHKSTALLFARDLIWAVGACKWKKTVKSFIADIEPDIIYLPIYASLYMCEVGKYAIKCAGVPVVGHISDDLWNYSPVCTKFSLSYFYRWWLRKKEYKLIRTTSYLEVFAQNMKEEYEEVFHRPCYVIGKGVNPESVSRPKKPLYKEGLIHFVYTGGIGGERYPVLIELGKAFDRQASKKCVLDIYTATPLTADMESQIKAVFSIRFHGAVSGSEVVKIQEDGDYLVHVEGFSEQSIFSTRMSFSTKIIDYLSTGNVMFAIGPSEINSIQILKNRKAGIVVDDISKLDSVLAHLLSGAIDTEEIQSNAYNYLTTERLKSNIQKGIKDRMLNLLVQN